MNMYEKYVLPQVINCVCGLKPMMRQREKVVPHATGVVLEIGVGSGLNLPYYDAHKVKQIIGIDPTPAVSKLQSRVDNISIPFELIKKGAESLDLDNQSIDTVVVTYTFCTIPDVESSLAEIRRVIKPQGEVLFIEHGKAPDESVRRTQDRINPIWRRLSGGCHLNRDIPALLQANGFDVNQLEEMYLPGWKPATYNVWGSASSR
jgi:ubiquinone/menaquinone biosynthesis C-methylase UbiE